MQKHNICREFSGVLDVCVGGWASTTSPDILQSSRGCLYHGFIHKQNILSLMLLHRVDLSGSVSPLKCCERWLLEWEGHSCSKSFLVQNSLQVSS